MAKHYYVSENINEGSFEDLDEIFNSTFDMDFDAQRMEKDGIPIISDGHQARGYHSEQPVMVVAATGSGKTRRIIIQYIISCILSACSMIINDPKGELYKHTKKLLEKLGYKVIVVDLRNLDYGERFNFCEHPARLWKSGNTRRADEMFQAMFNTFMEEVKSEKDPFWHTTGATYLTGLAELACDLLPAEMVSINTIYEIHIQGSRKTATSCVLKSYLDMHQDKSYYKLIAPYINAPNETRASLDSVLTSAISKFCRNPSVVDQTTNSTFNISDIVEEKTALFIISRDESTVYNALITAMVNEIYEVVIDIAEDKYNGRLPRRLSIILDEFGNLAPISDINSKITVSRSRNVGWCLCCQSLDQLNLKYTAEVAKIILGNCNIAYMYSSDISLLKMLSDLCGKTTDEYTNESKPLLSVEQLRHFDKDEGQTLFLLERKRPFIGFIPDISEYSVIPEEKLDIRKRKPQVIERIDFDSIVRNDRDSRKPGRSDSMYNDLPFDGRRPRIPTFEEFLADRERQKKETNEKKDVAIDLSDSDVSNSNNYVDELVARIDKRIAEIEEQERREEAARKEKAQKKQEARKNQEASKKPRSTIVFERIKSFDETARVVSECLGVSEEAARKYINQALTKGNRRMTGIPDNIALKMISRFKKIGTIASRVEDAA